MLLKTVDEWVVDRSQLNPGKTEPDQEVTGFAPIVVEPTHRDRYHSPSQNFVGEGTGETVELSWKGLRKGGTWTLQGLHAVRLWSEKRTLPEIAKAFLPSETGRESR